MAKERHGLSYTPIYAVWLEMKRRCLNKNNHKYSSYGGRGISICSEWVSSFISFYNWSVNNGWQQGLQIDRINNNGNYEPSNCRWATQKEQARNKRSNIVIEYNNQSLPLCDWCEKLGLYYKTINKRISRMGWTAKEAFETPIQVKSFLP